MAAVEIRAATLPGFPYYFPYRTGVRLTATPTGTVHKKWDGSPEVTAASVGITAAMTRTRYAEAALAVSATADTDESQSAVASALLAVQASPTPADVHLDRGVSAELAVQMASVTRALYNQVDGNPMWLSFFFAGLGRQDTL